MTNVREAVVDGIWWCWNTDGASRLKNLRNLSDTNCEALKYHIFGCYVKNQSSCFLHNEVQILHF